MTFTRCGKQRDCAEERTQSVKEHSTFAECTVCEGAHPKHAQLFRATKGRALRHALACLGIAAILEGTSHVSLDTALQ